MENPFNPGYYRSEELRGMGFAHIGDNVSIAKDCTIIGLHNVSIGNHVRIDGHTVIAAAKGKVIIRSHVHIGGGSFLAGAGGITLEDFSGLSQGCKIYSASDDYSGTAMTNPTIPAAYLNVKIAPVTLRRHVILGAGSIVLPGCTLKEGAAVGALSIVTRDLEAWGIYAGTPAKHIRQRDRKPLEFEAELLNGNHPTSDA